MAKWRVNQAGLIGEFEYEAGAGKGESTLKYYQDERPFIEQAKRDREATQKENNSKMRKFATIPEIVAIEIKTHYGIDIHAPDFMADVDKKAKFFQIIRQEYPYLVVNT